VFAANGKTLAVVSVPAMFIRRATERDILTVREVAGNVPALGLSSRRLVAVSRRRPGRSRATSLTDARALVAVRHSVVFPNLSQLSPQLRLCLPCRSHASSSSGGRLARYTRTAGDYRALVPAFCRRVSNVGLSTCGFRMPRFLAQSVKA
jgi:hypothetical protein